MIKSMLIATLLLISLNAFSMILAYVDFPPYSWQENGRAKGVQVQIVGSIFKNAHIELELIYLPFKRAYQDVKEGKIDGLFNFYQTPERVQWFDYSASFIKNPLVIFKKTNRQIDINNLQGLKVGVMRGYTYGNDFDNASTFTRYIVDSHESAFLLLKKNRIDVYPCDYRVGNWHIEKLTLQKEIDSISQPLKIMNGHIGFTKGVHQKNIQKINTAIKNMIKSGEIETIIKTALNHHENQPRSK